MAKISDSRRDLTGRTYLVSNVLTTWVAQGVYMAAGFVLPRTIDRHLGKDLLGVWDFAWSLVGYFGMVQLGVVGSINRFVARYRAQEDAGGVNRAVSSVTAVLVGMAGLILLGLAMVRWVVMPRYAGRLGSNLGEAEWVIFFLGLEVAVQTCFAGFNGVLTGCHRWKLNTTVQTSGYGVSAVIMVVSLLLGAKLRVLALVHLLGLAGSTAVTIYFAYRVFPELRVRFALARMSEALELLRFGVKSFVPQIGELFLNQTVSVLVLAYLGPAALAVYSRPRNLVASMRSLVMKMGGVLLPSSGALEANGDLAAVQSLAVKTTRYTAFMTFPMAVALVVMGGPILELWMGRGYRDDLLPAILSIGTVLNLVQIPVLAIVAGINRHGPPGRAHFAGCMVTAISAWVALRFLKVGLEGMVIAATAPMALLYMFYMPIYTARCLQVPVWSYLKGAMAGPMAMSALLAGSLLAARVAFRGNPLLALMVGCTLGAFLLAPMYWRWALPASLKERLTESLPRFLVRPVSPPGRP